jgi:hypothetical protein
MFRFFVSGRMWDPLRRDDRKTETSSINAIINRHIAKKQGQDSAKLDVQCSAIND